jgi:hypothetical protein
MAMMASLLLDWSEYRPTRWSTIAMGEAPMPLFAADEILVFL